MKPRVKQMERCDASTDRDGPIVSERYRRYVFNTLHRLSFPSVRANIRLIARRFCWPGMKKDMRN